MQRTLAGVIVLIAVIAVPATAPAPAGALPTWTPDTSTTVQRTEDCLEDPEPVPLDGLQQTRYRSGTTVPDGSTVDARDAGWQIGVGTLVDKLPWLPDGTTQGGGPRPWGWTNTAGRWPVVIGLSALARGTYHLYQGFGGFVGNIVMGVVLGLVFVRTRRVMPLVVCHALLDIVAFVGYTVLRARGVTL